MTGPAEATIHRLKRSGRRPRPRWLPLLLATALAALGLGGAAVPASAAIEILNRGFVPDPAEPGGASSIAVDVSVGQAPYIVEFACCTVFPFSQAQTKVVLDSDPSTQALRGTHVFDFNVGAGVNASDRQVMVRVSDSTGAQSTQFFEFRAPAAIPPPPAPDPAAVTPTGECPSVVEFGVIQAKQAGAGCWNKLKAGSRAYTDGNVPVAAGATHYEGTAAFRLNGIPFPAAPDGVKYVLVEPSPGNPGGQFGITGSVRVTLGPITVIDKPLLMKLPVPDGNGEGTFLGLQVPDGLLGGLKVSGEAKVIFRKRNGAFATSFFLNITLPSIFKPVPGDPATGQPAERGTLSGATEISVDNNGKVNLDGGKVEVAKAAIGKLELKNLCFSYLSANVSAAFAACAPPSLDGAPVLDGCVAPGREERYDGSILIKLPTKSGTELAAYGGISGGQFAYGGGFGDSLNIPIVQGITLERVGFGICLKPKLVLRLDGGLGFAGGLVRGNVKTEYRELPGKGFSIEAAGFMTVADIPFGDGFVKVTSTGAVDFAVNGTMPLAGGVILLRGGVAGFVQVQPFAFNLDGRLSLCLNLGGISPEQCANASATVSNLGAGGCLSAETFFGSIAFSAMHFYKKPAKGPQTDYGFGCGFQDRVRVQRATRAQAGSPLVFDVPENNDKYVAHVKGVDSAPKVRVTSPTGKTFQSGDGPVTTDQSSFIIIESAADNETSVFLSKEAAPGDWKIEGTITAISDLEIQADESQPTVVAADVTKAGDDRVIDMRAFIKRGEKVSLAVVGEDYEQKITPNAAGRACAKGVKAPGHTTGQSKCARIAFTPTFGYGGKRTLQATIIDTDTGGIVDVVDLDTFTAAPPRLPAKVPEIRLVRKGQAVIAIWGDEDSKETARYNATAELSDGRRIGQASPANCFAWRITGVRSSTSVTLRISAGRQDLEFGKKTAPLTLRGGQAYSGPAKLRTARIPRTCAGI